MKADKLEKNYWVRGLMLIAIGGLLSSCGISLYERRSTPDDSDQYVDGYYDGYDDGKDIKSNGETKRAKLNKSTDAEDRGGQKSEIEVEIAKEQKVTKVTYRTWRQVDQNGNVTIVKVEPGQEEKEVKQVDGKKTEVRTYFPRGVEMSCYGAEPFNNQSYDLETYLTNLETPSYMQLILSVDNADELSENLDLESGLENTLNHSTLTYTVSKIVTKKDQKVILPVKTYNIKNPLAVDINRIGNSEYSFKIMMLPVFLDESIYSNGTYTVSDIWLTYIAGKNKLRKISGACPRYHFSIGDEAFAENPIASTDSEPIGISNPASEEEITVPIASEEKTADEAFTIKVVDEN